MAVSFIGGGNHNTNVPRENHRTSASQWQTLSHNVVSSTHRHEWDSDSQLFKKVVKGNDCRGIYHRCMGHGFRFLLPPFLYYPLFSKFSYESFVFQNFHNHSFFFI